MSYKFVFLPPVNDRHRAWAEDVRSEVQDIEIVLAQSRNQALKELGDARAASRRSTSPDKSVDDLRQASP